MKICCNESNERHQSKKKKRKLSKLFLWQKEELKGVLKIQTNKIG